MNTEQTSKNIFRYSSFIAKRTLKASFDYIYLEMISCGCKSEI